MSNITTVNNNYAEETYRVWAHDNQVYGPIDLTHLVAWVQEGRVLSESWVFLEKNCEWRPARNIEPLTPHFPPGEETAFLQQKFSDRGGITLEELRQIAILSGLPNEALGHLIDFGQLLCLQPDEIVLQRWAPGDALFFVLAGLLRARLIVGFEDKTLARIGAGEVFGEMAMLTQSPRSADVVCVEPARLLRLGADAFRQLIEKNPEAAAPILFAIARMMANRLKDNNWVIQRDTASEFLWR